MGREEGHNVKFGTWSRGPGRAGGASRWKQEGSG